MLACRDGVQCLAGFRVQHTVMEHVASSSTAEQIVSALSAVAATRHGQVQSQQQRDRGNSRAAGDALRACVDAVAATHSSTDAGAAAFWLSFVTSGGLDALFSALSRLSSDDKPRAVEAAVRLALVSRANGATAAAVQNAVRDWMPRAPQYLSEAYLEVQLHPAASVGEFLFAEGRGKATATSPVPVLRFRMCFCEHQPTLLQATQTSPRWHSCCFQVSTDAFRSKV
jgi:hypothetical protein